MTDYNEDMLAKSVSVDTKSELLAEEVQMAEAYESIRPKWVELFFRKPMRVPWDWRVLFQDAASGEQDDILAIIGLALSRACEKSSERVESTLGMLGFSHMVSSHYNSTDHKRNDVSEPARTFAHKAIGVDNKTMHVVCAVFRGTTSFADILTDLRSVDDGFYYAGRSCAEALVDYVQGIEGITYENTIYFITGHSLGGAAANIAARLTRDFAGDSMRFVYTYGSPNYDCGIDYRLNKPFANFHTFSNAADSVPTLPSNFPRIGIEHTYDLVNFDNTRRERFEKIYTHFSGVAFADDDPLGPGVSWLVDDEFRDGYKNHVTLTYLALILSGLSEEKVKRYLESPSAPQPKGVGAE